MDVKVNADGLSDESKKVTEVNDTFGTKVVIDKAV